MNESNANQATSGFLRRSQKISDFMLRLSSVGKCLKGVTAETVSLAEMVAWWYEHGVWWWTQWPAAAHGALEQGAWWPVSTACAQSQHSVSGTKQSDQWTHHSADITIITRLSLPRNKLPCQQRSVAKIFHDHFKQSGDSEESDTCEDHLTRGWIPDHWIVLTCENITTTFCCLILRYKNFSWAPCDQWLEKVKYPKLYRSIGFIIGSTFPGIIISSVFWIDRFSNICNSSVSLGRLSSFVTSANKDQGRVIIYLLFG